MHRIVWEMTVLIDKVLHNIKIPITEEECTEKAGDFFNVQKNKLGVGSSMGWFY